MHAVPQLIIHVWSLPLIIHVWSLPLIIHVIADWSGAPVRISTVATSSSIAPTTLLRERVPTKQTGGWVSMSVCMLYQLTLRYSTYSTLPTAASCHCHPPHRCLCPRTAATSTSRRPDRCPYPDSSADAASSSIHSSIYPSTYLSLYPSTYVSLSTPCWSTVGPLWRWTLCRTAVHTVGTYYTYCCCCWMIRLSDRLHACSTLTLSHSQSQATEALSLEYSALIR